MYCSFSNGEEIFAKLLFTKLCGEVEYPTYKDPSFSSSIFSIVVVVHEILSIDFPVTLLTTAEAFFPSGLSVNKMRSLTL